MDITTFLSQLWGPVLVAIGVGIFTSPRQYTKLYRDLEKESLATLIFAGGAIAIGILQIQAHNLWNSLPQVVISIIGWGTLVKGVIFAVWPRLVDRAGDWEADSKLIPFAGIAMLVIGIYLSWVGFFS